MFVNPKYRFYKVFNYRRALNLNRKNKSYKRHAESYFNFRRKLFLYYYKRNKKINFWEKNIHKNQMSRKFKFSFKSLDKCYLVKTPLISHIKLTKRFSNANKFKYAFQSRIITFPDFALTSKPKSIRMGKGKGDVTKFIYFLKIGNIISELRFKRNRIKLMNYSKLLKFKYNYMFKKVIRKLAFKFPVKTHASFRIW